MVTDHIPSVILLFYFFRNLIVIPNAVDNHVEPLILFVSSLQDVGELINSNEIIRGCSLSEARYMLDHFYGRTVELVCDQSNHMHYLLFCRDLIYAYKCLVSIFAESFSTPIIAYKVS